MKKNVEKVLSCLVVIGILMSEVLGGDKDEGKKNKGKVLSIALVALMLGTLISTLPSPVFAEQVGQGFKDNYEGYNSEIGGTNPDLRFKVEYDADSDISTVTSLREGYADYGVSWTFNHSTLSGHGKATHWSGTSGWWEPHEIRPEDRMVSLPQNFPTDMATYHREF